MKKVKYRITGLDGTYEGTDLKDIIKQVRSKTANFVRLNGTVDIYTDGSFTVKGCYGGFIAYMGDEEIHRDFTQVTDTQYLASRNVAAECAAAMLAAQWAAREGYEEVVIHHDYEGVAKWATGEWKANKIVSREYKKYMTARANEVKISYQWVKGHATSDKNNAIDEYISTIAGRGA